MILLLNVKLKFQRALDCVVCIVWNTMEIILGTITKETEYFMNLAVYGYEHANGLNYLQLNVLKWSTFSWKLQIPCY